MRRPTRTRPALSAPLAALASVATVASLAACRDQASLEDAGAADLAPASPDLAGAGPGDKPLGGTISQKAGPDTGSVDRLFFGFTGDTRPSNMDDTAGYPTATITQIFSRMAEADVQLALDLGDHMYVVGATDQAKVQMGLYTTAAQSLGSRPYFMVLGNHDCGTSNCYYSLSDPNFAAFTAALAPASSSPYYSFTVATRSGPAVFVVESDNYVDGHYFDWLDKTLAAADQTAKYTIVARHHPLGTTENLYVVADSILQKHRYALFLTGHSHTYRRDMTDPSGRTIIYGLGGVPNSGPHFGYGTVQQGLDDRLYVTIYDAATDMPIDHFDVGPNP